MGSVLFWAGLNIESQLLSSSTWTWLFNLLENDFFRNSVTILTDWVKSGWTEKRDDLVKPYSHHHLGITADLLRYHNYLWCHRCHLDSWHSVFHLWNFKNTSSKNNITVFTFFLWQTDNLGWSGKYLPEKSLKLTLNRTFIILRLYLIKY